jgi:hypothetical protein
MFAQRATTDLSARRSSESPMGYPLLGESSPYPTPDFGRDRVHIGIAGNTCKDLLKPFALQRPRAMRSDLPQEDHLVVAARDIKRELRPVGTCCDITYTGIDSEPPEQARDVIQEATTGRTVVNSPRSTVAQNCHRTISSPEMTKEKRYLIVGQPEHAGRYKLLMRPQAV